ncbi:MAG: tetratricopeptide repeat protein [Bacteroidia bacterium]|nr:tetratricopeptide repeat protein [Bacteroidia bacterium]
MRWILTIFIGFLVIVSIDAQDFKLAQQYYQSGEYEKASIIYKKLYEANPRNDYFFNQFIECLLSLEAYDECEKTISKRIKKNPQEIQLYVSYGNLFERQYLLEEAEEQYRKAIKKLYADRTAITRLANAFTGLTKYDLAIETYEQGGKLLKDKSIFAYNLGDMYRRKGDIPKMIDNYLNSLASRPNRLNTVKTIMQRTLAEEDYLELQTQLYTRIQKDKDNVILPDLLTWVFIQKKDYRNALRQVKAIDRTLNENGNRIYRLADIASNDNAYDAAIEAYEYIVEEKGRTSTFYLPAKRRALWCKKQRIIDGYDYSMDDLRSIEADYELFLNEFGYNSATAPIILQLAEFEALYINDLDKAINLLKQIINFAGTDRYVLANSKLNLADYFLMQGERWESTLLYSQVDKEFNEDLLGHEARFRNARLSYFNGDFEWAQAQFDILKASTSKLIANDALDLSVFITDNMGLDTTAVPLMSYATAELLVFQNKFDDAFTKLDEIIEQFPDHSLEDDILYLKAQIYKKKKDFKRVVELYNTIISDFGDEIKADNAMFELAQLYEGVLAQPDKAMELYEKLFIEYSGSTFAVLARKQFRKLRGDSI